MQLRDMGPTDSLGELNTETGQFFIFLLMLLSFRGRGSSGRNRCFGPVLANQAEHTGEGSDKRLGRR